MTIQFRNSCRVHRDPFNGVKCEACDITFAVYRATRIAQQVSQAHYSHEYAYYYHYEVYHPASKEYNDSVAAQEVWEREREQAETVAAVEARLTRLVPLTAAELEPEPLEPEFPNGETRDTGEYDEYLYAGTGQETTNVPVCESCLTAASGEFIPDDLAEDVCREAGAEIGDHYCESKETREPCGCSCRNGLI